MRWRLPSRARCVHCARRLRLAHFRPAFRAHPGDVELLSSGATWGRAVEGAPRGPLRARRAQPGRFSAGTSRYVGRPPLRFSLLPGGGWSVAPFPGWAEAEASE
eukprot:9409834-Alexandrium_andersonii.AAC.1